ncbi:MAG: prolyl oligopeptidase [Gammaproteobacteria bacterium]|jgi:prolyl oligopeptidase
MTPTPSSRSSAVSGDLAPSEPLFGLSVPLALRLVLVLGIALAAGACVGQRANGIDPDGEQRVSGKTEQSLDWSAVADWEEARTYPAAHKGDVVDLHHGVEVADPYRWLEDADAAATGSWIEAENQLTHGLLQSIPSRAATRERLESLWDYERSSLPSQRGGHVFYSKNDGLQNQAVLFVADSLEQATADEGRVLLDPNSFSEDGTIALAGTNPSPDGRLLAYATSDGGSDWRTWYFLEIESGKLLPDILHRNKFGGLDWVDGSEKVVYSSYGSPDDEEALRERNTPATICMHTLGNPESQDLVLREAPEEGKNQYSSITNSRRALIVSTIDTASRKNEVYILSLVGENLGNGLQLIEGFDAQYSYIGNDGDRIWFRTDLDAPNWRVIEVNLDQPDRSQWRELVPESTETLSRISAVGGHLVASYLKNASTQVRVFDLEGEFVRNVDLPGLGSAGGFGGELDQATTHFQFTSFTTPGEIWSYEVATGKRELFRRPTVDFDPEQFETRQVFYSSKDGTSIPMFIVHRRGLELDGSNPTLLYGYGGFNISLTPSFSVRNIVWMEQGGIYAVPSLRGGGEFGEDWHAAGTKLNKQNVFDDFIAAAEWLIAEKYTSSDQLAISGGSNGGLLVGACMTQRPGLFGACLPAVGVMDMLRYHLFTIGWAWVGDYGSVDQEDEFHALLDYSPYHNIGAGVSYPPTLVTTADRDDRVVPAHSFKFAARLQEAQAGTSPTLIRIETRAGHGAGKPTSMRIDEAADVLAFLDYALGKR